jgi:hypothetical protein
MSIIASGVQEVLKVINKKHILISILVAGFILTLPACSNVAETTETQVSTSVTSTKSSNYKAPDFPEGMEHEPPQGMGIDISNEDIFEKGYYAVQYDSFPGAYFYWSSKNNSGSDIEWSVYLSDKELSEDEIKELAKTKSLGVNEGSDAISEGQWIYVLCSINKETASAPVDATFHLSSFRDYA